MKALMSIVILTRNSSKTIEESLSAIQERSYQNVETIIIDSKSTDDTTQIAAGQRMQSEPITRSLFDAGIVGCHTKPFNRRLCTSPENF